MSYMMAGLSIFSLMTSMYGAHQKRQLNLASANETLTQTAENAIAGKMTKSLKTKEFYRGIKDVRKKGAYTKAMIGLKGEQKRARNLVQRSTRGAKLNKFTTLDLAVEDVMITEYMKSMTSHETFTTMDNMNHSFHDWESVHDWQQKIMLRRGKKKAELQKKGADVSAFGDVTSGITQSGILASKGNWSWGGKGGNGPTGPEF